MTATLKAIGHIKTPYKTIAECPRNIRQNQQLCQLVLKKKFKQGLLGLKKNQKILIMYWFEQVDRKKYQQPSRKTRELSGTFALRSPHRPNPIGAAIIKIEKIRGRRIFVRGLDCLHKTPLLDIKPAILDENR